MTEYGKYKKPQLQASTMPYNDAKEKRREVLANVRKKRAESIKTK